MKCKVKKVKRGRRIICDPGVCDHCTYVGEGDFLCDNTADEAYVVEQSYKQCVAAFASGDVKDFGFFATLTEDGIRGWGEMIYIKGETLDDYKARKGVTDSDQYLIGDYAYIDRNGDWSGSGDMGWFGISSNDKPERTWKDELQAFMDEVQDDDFIAIVDCHI